ncbi:reticulon-like protein B7 isoform X1 [Eutrema salsugineum]|uniref:reticulon-like protein B7 isoform X1 n=1 Tax=Eutrema salsugineum TaxID=72664 RepID=UPI000CED0917|nr:reticulon-like protein B7 isoform X1 [Eutrema salsugineum]
MEEEHLKIVGPLEEPLMENIESEEVNGLDSLSSSDTDSEKPDSPVPINAPIYRMFGRERPIHMVLGGGKPADVLLWRDKKVTAGLLSAVTVIWLLFGFGHCHLLTFVCRGSILFLLLSFLWSNALNNSPENIMEIYIPEKPLLQAASALTFELNCAFATLRSIALERDIKNFAMALIGLWLVSIIGNWFSFLSLLYICFVFIHTVPMLYEKYEDEIDPIAEKAVIEMKKHYQVFKAKVLC